MNIGIFDSGLGGLIITRAIKEAMNEYDYVYMGDTLHVPYGARSRDAVYEFTKNCIDTMFREYDCMAIIIACNTASAVLARLQQEYLPQNYPDRRILGMVIPTAEVAAASNGKRIGLLATEGTVRSNIYGDELTLLDKNINLFSVAAPLLVPLIENDGDKFAMPVIMEYIQNFPDIDTLILGCTHYPHYKYEIRSLLPNINLLSQDEIIPEKLREYFSRHPEIESRLSRNGTCRFFVTDISDSYMKQANRMFGSDIDVVKI